MDGHVRAGKQSARPTWHHEVMVRVLVWGLSLVSCWSESRPANQPVAVAPRSSQGQEQAQAQAQAQAGSAHSPSQAVAAPAPLPFSSACVAANDPAVAQVQTRAAAATRSAFEAELARKHLRVIALGAHHEEIGQGLTYSAPHEREGTAVRKKLGTAQGTFIAAETSWSGSAGFPRAWEFVQDDRGDVYRLRRKPSAAVTRVVLCACRPQQCGPYGSGCPACGSTSQTMYGPLPVGATYRGELELAYPANVVSIEYDPNQKCPAPRACPPPPP